MIKDITTDKTISQYGGENKIFIINTLFLDFKAKEKKVGDMVINDEDIYFYAPIKWRGKDCYVLMDTLEDADVFNYYAYQSLILHLGAEVNNGLIIDKIANENNEFNSVILTVVKDQIPISSYYIPTIEWEKHEMRILGIYDISSTIASKKIITQADYNTKSLKKLIPFTASMTKEGKMDGFFASLIYNPFISNALQFLKKVNWDLLISLSILVFILHYSYSAYQLTNEKKMYEKKQKQLIKKKQQIEQELLGFSKNMNIDIERYKGYVLNTNFVTKLFPIILESSPLSIIRRYSSSGLEISNYSPKLLRDLKNKGYEFVSLKGMDLQIVSKEDANKDVQKTSNIKNTKDMIKR